MVQFDIPQLPDNLLAHKKVNEAFQKLRLLAEAIDPRPIPEDIKVKIQVCLNIIAENTHDKKAALKALKKSSHTIVKLLEKEMKLVPKNYYKVLWTSLGLAVFGIPFGVAISTSIGNMAFIGIGLPIGIGIGIAVGVSMDKKAAAEGRQLPVDL